MKVLHLFWPSLKTHIRIQKSTKSTNSLQNGAYLHKSLDLAAILDFVKFSTINSIHQADYVYAMSKVVESSEKKLYQPSQGILTWLPDYTARPWGTGEHNIRFSSDQPSFEVMIDLAITIETPIRPFPSSPQIARFMGPTWGPSGAYRTQVGPMLAPWTLLSGSGGPSRFCSESHRPCTRTLVCSTSLMALLIRSVDDLSKCFYQGLWLAVLSTDAIGQSINKRGVA